MSWAPFLSWEGEQGSTDKNGLETVNISYYVETREEARFWMPPDLEKELGLPVMRRGYQREWGNGRLLAQNRDGAFRVTFSLEGVQVPKEGENGVQFDADGTLSEDKPEAHPELPRLLELYEGQVEDNKLVFPPTITVDGQEIKNDLFGWKKWRNAGVIWTKTYLSLRPSPSVTERLNKIDTPPTGPGGYLPQLPGKRNWLKIIGKPAWRGNTWKVTEAWEMSGDGGWNEDVYR